MDPEKITAYSVAVVAVIGAIANHFRTRKKDTAADERADRKLVAGHSDKLFARMLARIEHLEGRMTTLVDEHSDCQSENAALRGEIEKLKQQNAEQAKRIGELERQLGNLSRESR